MSMHGNILGLILLADTLRYTGWLKKNCLSLRIHKISFFAPVAYSSDRSSISPLKNGFSAFRTQGTSLSTFPKSILLPCFLALFKTRDKWFNEFRLYLTAYKTARFHQINLPLHTHTISSSLSMDFASYF